MIKGLLWCLAILVMQLGLLRYVDRRVASMPPLDDRTTGDTAEKGMAIELHATRLSEPEGKLDA